MMKRALLLVLLAALPLLIVFTDDELKTDPVGYAHALYAALRDLDHAGTELIVVEAIPEGPQWAAVADRIRRAVTGAGG